MSGEPADERSTSTDADEQTRLLPSDAKHHNLAGLSPIRFRLICAALWSAVFLTAFDGTVVATLLSDIGSSFDASHQVAWLGTSYLLSLCCFTPIYGRLSDLLGRRNAHLIALSFFTFGTLLCGLAPSMYSLIAARVVAGIGGGGINSVSSIVMSDLVDLHHRGLFQGYVNIMFGLGAALGGPVGGWLSDQFGWRTAFLVQVPLLLGVGVAIFAYVKVPASTSMSAHSMPEVDRGRSKFRIALSRIDVLGSFTLVVAIATLLLSISLKTSTLSSSGEEYTWTSPLILSLLLTSLVFVSLFILVEAYYAPSPVLPLSLLARRTPLGVAISNFTMVTNNYSIIYNVPLYFSAVKLQSSSSAGAHLLPYSILIGGGSLFVGYIMRRTGKYWWASISAAMCIVVSAVMLLFWNKDSPEWLTWLAPAPSGFGYSGVLTSTLVALMTSVTREGKGEIAVATSMTYMFRSIGQVLGVALSAAIVQTVLKRDLHRLITGPDSEELIALIRRSTASIKDLPAGPRNAAISAYSHAIHVVFIFNLVLSVCTVLALLIIKEEEMPRREALKPSDEEEGGGQ